VANCELWLIETKSGIRTPLKFDFYFRFPISLTIEYKVSFAKFYLWMGFGADLLKNVVNRA